MPQRVREDGDSSTSEGRVSLVTWIARIGLAVTVVMGTYLGWKLFLFTTDDAYIAFRYVSNAMDGHGLVWNPPPFRPVEGYTSFLWVVLLKQIWSVIGLEPPRVANFISLGFGYGSLFIIYRMLWRMELPALLARHRLALLALVFLGTLSNRTFMTWLSSGLETAMFNFFFIAWISEGLRGKGASRRHDLFLSASAALSALSRPDGTLMVLATPLILLARDRGGSAGMEEDSAPSPVRTAARRLANAWPLLAIPAHYLWRVSFYGEWLPNTYYAKYVSPWPESGARYLASFVIENGVWVWVL